MKKNGIVNINSDELNNIDNIKPLIDRYSPTNFIHPTDPEITEIEQQKNPIDDFIFNDNFEDMMKYLLNVYYGEKTSIDDINIKSLIDPIHNEKKRYSQ